ncbi:MAG: SDR family NAD(P)-dependent oxidoreductase [Erysipelotrichaceae bacterium]|nr:SDR family NAD(P)-dependent oxidoreductase [Erysipelotrichaceae bacterium]
MKKVAIITGASSGMGKEFVLTLDNYLNVDEIWAVARSKAALEDLKKMVNTEVRAIPMDLTDQECFFKMQELLEEEKPDVRLLINASGFGIFDSTNDMKMADAEGMVDLNCKAIVKMTKLALPYMYEGARIMNIASMAAFQPTPYMNVYSASRHLC